MSLPKIELDQWQKEALEHDGDLLLCIPRQIGKTTIMARKASEYLVKHKNKTIVVVSLTEDQAQLMIIMVLDYLQKTYPQYLKGLKKNQKATKSTIHLNNGSWIIARPVGNTGDAVRGFTGDILIIDEASRMNEMIFEAAEPTLASTGGQIWMCSTPFGKKGYFYNCYLNEDKSFKVIHVESTEEIYKTRPLSDAWSEMRREKALERLNRAKNRMSSMAYAQEHLAQFVDDLQQFFPDAIIQRCMTLKRPETIDKRRTHFLGVDVARLGEDESTFEILKLLEDGTLHHVENLISKKTLLTQTATTITYLEEKYNFNKIFVDDEGIGVGVLDILLTEELTKRKTEALRNSKKITDYKDNKKARMLKEDLYWNLLRLMEQNKIYLLDDPNIFQSLKSVQYEYTTDKKGKPFLHIFGNYTHIVEGLIRAAWGIKSKNLNIWLDWF